MSRVKYKINSMSAFWMVLLIFFIVVANCSFAQQKDSVNSFLNKNTTSGNMNTTTAIVDTGLKKIEILDTSMKKSINSLIAGIKKSGTEKFKSIAVTNTDSTLKRFFFKYSLKGLLKPGPLVKLNGGFISYNLNYRSNIDTPFLEKNILQHNIYGNMNLSVAGIPLKINYLIRRSNSTVFRDINDIQFEFDAMQFGNTIRAGIREKLLSLAPGFTDSLLVLDYKINFEKLKKLKDELNSSERLQKLAEYNELLNVPGITNESKLPETVNRKRAAALKNEAKVFIDQYDKSVKEWEATKGRVDSLEILYTNSISKIERYKNLVTQKLNGVNSVDGLMQDVKGYGINSITLPKKYQWLLNVKKMGIGKNQLNYSELTSKNMSLTGINFEYNSWYYAAVSAGSIDYQFRDFVISRNKRTPQYMYLARLGIGKLESSHLIFSTYKGQKQLFATGINNASTKFINVTGIAAEAKYSISGNKYLQIEVAESISPDFRNNPATTTKFDFNDKSNKAISAIFYSYFPKTASHIEVMYKFTGANFQSFSSFQTNAEVKAWHVKADQQFFKRKLKIAASLRSNEFNNPYIIQNYSSNTVFKSLQATFRSRKFPVITVGYIPTSQITSVDSQLVENHFYSFNTGVTHTYRIGERNASSVLIYNKFYNNESDTSYLYYNAENIFFNQNILFSLYTMNLSISHSKSTSFELNVLDAGLQFKFCKTGSVGFGVKVNEFDREASETGGYGSFQFSIKRLGFLNIVYDDGFIPASNHRFVRNKMMNLSFTRIF